MKRKRKEKDCLPCHTLKADGLGRRELPTQDARILKSKAMSTVHGLRDGGQARGLRENESSVNHPDGPMLVHIHQRNHSVLYFVAFSRSGSCLCSKDVT